MCYRVVSHTIPMNSSLFFQIAYSSVLYYAYFWGLIGF